MPSPVADATHATPPAWSFRCSRCDAAVPLLAGGRDLVCAACATPHPWRDGILMLGGATAAARGDGDYPEELYDFLAGEEDRRHFWFEGRSRLIVQTLAEALHGLDGRSVLDVGCGTGLVLAALERAGMRGCGLDMHLAALRHARARVRGPLLCESATRVPFRDTFDAVTLCDVIEHTDDEAALRESVAALRPGGWVLVTVPANPRLWSAVDDAYGHRRRYTRETLGAVMRQSGIDVHILRPFNILLYPLQALSRRLLGATLARAVRTPAADAELLRRSLRRPFAPLNALFRVAMAADGPLGRAGVQFGASLIALGTASGAARLPVS